MVEVSRNSGGVKADCAVVELGSRDGGGVELRHNSGCSIMRQCQCGGR